MAAIEDFITLSEHCDSLRAQRDQVPGGGPYKDQDSRDPCSHPWGSLWKSLRTEYLGDHIDNKLERSKMATFKRSWSCFLRIIRSFDNWRAITRMFYEAAFCSGIAFAVVRRGSRLTVADTKRLNRIMRKAGDVMGVKPGRWTQCKREHRGQYLPPRTTTSTRCSTRHWISQSDPTNQNGSAFPWSIDMCNASL